MDTTQELEHYSNRWHQASLEQRQHCRLTKPSDQWWQVKYIFPKKV